MLSTIRLPFYLIVVSSITFYGAAAILAGLHYLGLMDKIDRSNFPLFLLTWAIVYCVSVYFCNRWLNAFDRWIDNRRAKRNDWS